MVLRALLTLLLMTLVISPLFAQSSSETLKKLKDDLDYQVQVQILGVKYKDVHVGAMIQNLNTGDIILQNNPTKNLIPASAVKAIVAGITYNTYDKDHTFKTWLKTAGELKRGNLFGNVFIVGGGDPGLTTQQLESAIKTLKTKHKIKQIDGSLLYDESLFKGEGHNFSPNARAIYTPPGALSLNYNTIKVKWDKKQPDKLWLEPDTSFARISFNGKFINSPKPGKMKFLYDAKWWGDAYEVKGIISRWDIEQENLDLSVSRPGLFTATIAKELCEKNGIKVTGEIENTTAPRTAKILATIKGNTVETQLKKMLHESHNMLAEQFTYHLGRKKMKKNVDIRQGVSVIEEYITENIGIAPETFTIKNGSGLSLANRFSAQQFVTILDHFYKKNGNDFVSLFPRLGHSKRHPVPIPPDFLDIYIKTGTLELRGVNTAVGYLIDKRTNTPYAFAIIANRDRPTVKTYQGTLTNPLLQSIIDVFSEIQSAKAQTINLTKENQENSI